MPEVDKASLVYPEEVYGRKLDRCVTDTLIKGAGGFTLGAIFSLLFFKRRSWPLFVGSGFGIGVAYRTCERELNS